MLSLDTDSWRLIPVFRFFAVVMAALAGVAIWRRREIRGDAERASKAIAGAASSTRSRIRGGSEGGEGEDVDETESAATDGGDATEESDAAEPTTATS